MEDSGAMSDGFAAIRQRGKPPIEILVEGVPGRRRKVMVSLSDGNVEQYDIPLNPTSAKKLAEALLDAVSSLEIKAVHQS